MFPAVLLLLYLFTTTTSDLLNVHVVETPELGVPLAAALRAARGEHADVVQQAAEPGEPLARAGAVCRAAGAGAGAGVAGGGARRLMAAAAARAGLALLVAAPVNGMVARDVLSLYPVDDEIAQACVELCLAKGWRRVVVLHGETAGVPALLAAAPATLALLPRLLPDAASADDVQLRNLLLLLKKSGETRFVVWCSAACARSVLAAAARAGLLSDRHSYILLTLELHTLDLEPYSHGQANITGLRLFDADSPNVQEAQESWLKEYRALMQLEPSRSPIDNATLQRVPAAMLLTVEATRIADAAWERLGLPPAEPADCSIGRADFHADTLLNYIRSEEWEGAGGWRADGGRCGLRMQVAELQRGGSLQAVGSWRASAGLQWARPASDVQPAPSGVMTNNTFTILIAKIKPYVMRQESAERLTGNNQYEGFCVELIERLAELLQFNYTFVELEIGGNSMIKRLKDDPRADFAITDLTITSEREAMVDFTTPFMNLGISILFHAPTPPEPQFYGFLLPFSNGVWICLGFAYLGTSLVLYVVGRLCPEEWQNPHPCIEEPPALHNQFTLANALWFNLGAVLLQGSEIAPVAYGTRAVASIWWMFALVMTSSYTANLASLLTTTSSDNKIHNVQELADNPYGIKYGAMQTGSTFTFFNKSKNPLYQRMFEQMRQQKMPASNEEGIERVEKENFAFFMESTSIEYTIQRNCEVTKIGGLLDSKGYGIAMKKESPYRQAMNLALLNLQEAGVLREMQTRWWEEEHGGGACKAPDDHENKRLAMSSFWGLFVVLTVGCCMGVCVSLADLCVSAWRRGRTQPSRTYLQWLAEELRFVFRFDLHVKPVQGPLLPPEPTPTPPSSHTASGSPEHEEEPDGSPARPMSVLSGSRRRRSSIYTASARLARAAPDHR